MSRKNTLKKSQVLSNADSATSPLSLATGVSGLDNILYIIDIDATVDGSVIVEHCEELNPSPGSVWKSLNFGEDIILNSANDTEYTLAIKNQGFLHTRLSFSDNGGTGNINAWISGNTVGA